MKQKGNIQQSIEKIKARQLNSFDVEKMVEGILTGDITNLSRSITLIESLELNRRQLGSQILDRCMPYTGKSQRIGITGVPGVGKSTFIESFGLQLIEQGRKVAVLAVDPSSQVTGGSILGDKTRMEQLSVHPNAYIRPSPAGEHLGGVAARTREVILLCEAAGFDTILVETVGVGQSETMVHSMVDFFLLLMLAGAGDELQGIKRGIMELADQVLINKADGNNTNKAKEARLNYQRALHFFPPRDNGWKTVISTCSGLEGNGLKEAIGNIEQFFQEQDNYVIENRKAQNAFWLKEAVNDLISSGIMNSPQIKQQYRSLEEEVRKGNLSPYSAAKSFIDLIAHDR